MQEWIAVIQVSLIFVLPVAAFLRAQRMNASHLELLKASTLGGAAAGLTVVIVWWPLYDWLIFLTAFPFVVVSTIIGFVLGAILLGSRLVGTWLSNK